MGSIREPGVALGGKTGIHLYPVFSLIKNSAHNSVMVELRCKYRRTNSRRWDMMVISLHGTAASLRRQNLPTSSPISPVYSCVILSVRTIYSIAAPSHCFREFKRPASQEHSSSSTIPAAELGCKMTLRGNRKPEAGTY